MTDTKIVQGSAWMVGMRWSMRLIGLVSTIILARLLTPADFGLVAMAVIVVALLEIIGDTGVDLALLRNRDATREHYDTAWTIQVIQGAIITVLLLLVIEPAALYFDEPRVRGALGVLALRPMIEGFRNIGIVAFRKELDFAREFRFGVIHKLAGFAIVVTLALIWRSYWALIIGRVAAGAIGVVISYVMHEYRPRFSLKRFTEIWSFSQWLLLSRIGIFGNSNSDKFVVGGTAGTDAMGGYHIAKEIGSMLSNELIFPIRRALFPNFAILVAEKRRFQETVVLMISFAATMVIAVQFGLAAVSADFVAVILGPRWAHITPLIEILAFAGSATSLLMAAEFLLPVTNRARLAAIMALSELIVLVPTLVYVSRGGDITDVALARLLVAVVFLPIMYVVISRACDLSLRGMIGALWRPLAAGTLMFFVVRQAQSAIDLVPVARLIALIGVGAVTYCVSIALLWLLSGKPSGMEKQLWIRLKQLKAH